MASVASLRMTDWKSQLDTVRGKPTWWIVYGNYIASSEWHKKRAKALKRDGGECRICGSKSRLNVHHKTYLRCGDEDVNDLTTLCDECHKGITSMLRRRRKKYGKNTTMFDDCVPILELKGVDP